MLSNLLPDSCSGCPLSTNRSCGYFTKVSGSSRNGVLIVGEASGEQEGKEGRPFVEWAPAGSMLERAIRQGNFKREDFWITNMIRCRPPNNLLEGASYEREALAHCRPNLDRVIEELKPRAILAVGGIAHRELTGYAGRKMGVTDVRGYPLPGPGGITTIPTLHPSYIIRGNTRYLGLLIQDISRAVAAARGAVTYPADISSEITCLVGIEHLQALYEKAKEDPTLPIAWDLETKRSREEDEDAVIEFIESQPGDPADDRGSGGDGETGSSESFIEMESGVDASDRVSGEGSDESRGISNSDLVFTTGSIISIQFAVSDREGVFVRWDESGVPELSRLILGLPNPKLAWNGKLFDEPKIKMEAGIVPAAPSHDPMLMHLVLQPDLPAGLQKVAVNYGWKFPWKHLTGTNEALYGVSDVCALWKIYPRLRKQLEAAGLWAGYEKYQIEYRDKVLQPWEERGIPMSVKRLDEFREWLQREVVVLTTEMLSHIPDSLNKKDPPKGYANLPDKIKPIVYEKHPDLLKQVITKKLTVSEVYRRLLIGELGRDLFNDIFDKFPELRLGDFDDKTRLYNHVSFNPRSPKQMIEYLKVKGYRIPLDFKKGTPTTSDKEMMRLENETKDPVIKLSREIRVTEKMQSSYTGKVGEDGIARGGWVPDPDGRLRTRAVSKSTGQLASLSPNVFTLPKKRGDLAKRFRMCMEAEPGHKIVAFDYKAFHDLMTANLATDEAKWRTAKLDPHTYVAGFLVNYPGIYNALKMSDEDLKLYLKEIRSKHEKVRDNQAKPLNHGTNFGQGYKRLFSENREYFKDETEAKKLLNLLKSVYPKTFQWQEMILKSLDTDDGGVNYLQSVWGTRRWFWEVWKWEKSKYTGKWEKRKGQDAEKAIAYLPANCSHIMFRTKQLEMADLGWLDKYELINMPHDELLFHPLDKYVDECIENVKAWMEAPVKELANPILCPEGFSCGVDVHVGPNRGELEEVK